MYIRNLSVMLSLVLFVGGCTNVQGNAKDPTSSEIKMSSFPFPMWNDSGGKPVAVYISLPNGEPPFKMLKGVMFNQDQISINADQVIWIKGWIDLKAEQNSFISFGQEEKVQVKDLIWKMSDGSWNAYSM